VAAFTLARTAGRDIRNFVRVRIRVRNGSARFIASPDKQIPYSSSPLGEREGEEGQGGEGPAAAEVAKQNVESPESSVTNFRITERLRTASSRLGNSPANSRLGRGLKVKLAGRLAESRSFPFPDWPFRPQAGSWSFDDYRESQGISRRPADRGIPGRLRKFSFSRRARRRSGSFKGSGG